MQYKTDLPVSVPKAGEVLVKNDFIGINYIDTYITHLLSLRKPDLTASQIDISAQDFTPPPNPRFLAAKQKARSCLWDPQAISTVSLLVIEWFG